MSKSVQCMNGLQGHSRSSDTVPFDRLYITVMCINNASVLHCFRDSTIFTVNVKVKAGASIPMRQGDMSPNIYEGGTSMVMSPNILEVVSFRMSTRVTATVVCCILTQILCVVSQKKLQLTPYRGSAPGPRWGPQTPSLLLCPPMIL